MKSVAFQMSRTGFAADDGDRKWRRDTSYCRYRDFSSTACRLCYSVHPGAGGLTILASERLFG